MLGHASSAVHASKYLLSATAKVPWSGDSSEFFPSRHFRLTLQMSRSLATIYLRVGCLMSNNTADVYYFCIGRVTASRIAVPVSCMPCAAVTGAAALNQDYAVAAALRSTSIARQGCKRRDTCAWSAVPYRASFVCWASPTPALHLSYL